MQGYGPPMPRQEVMLFNGNGIQVTSARLVCWQQTYPIANITSVAPFSVYPSHGGTTFGIFFGVCLALVALVIGGIGVAAKSSGAIGYGVVFGLVGIGLVVVCILAARAKKPTHGVMITTAGVNVRAISSADTALVQAVIAALNNAIAVR